MSLPRQLLQLPLRAERAPVARSFHISIPTFAQTKQKPSPKRFQRYDSRAPTKDPRRRVGLSDSKPFARERVHSFHKKDDVKKQRPRPRAVVDSDMPRQPRKERRPAPAPAPRTASVQREPVDPVPEPTPTKRPFPPEVMDVKVLCHPGLEEVLYSELRELKLDFEPIEHGAMLSNTQIGDLNRCHLWLGSATSVMIRCGDPFLARGLGELKRKVEQLPWKQILDGCAFKVKVQSSRKSRLLHTTAIRDRVVEGIQDSLGCQEVNGDRGATVVVRIEHDKAQLWLDTSDTPIYRRGYRLAMGKAPLREDLAFAQLKVTGWSGEGTFVDPFCGSGTIAIEAANMALGLPPGRLREAPLEGTRLFDPVAWKKAIKSAKARDAGSLSVAVVCSDRDAGVVNMVNENAKRAGVDHILSVHHCAFSANPILEQTASVPKKLFVAANLPFGRRVSGKLSSKNRTNALLPLYQGLANKLKSLEQAGSNLSISLLTDNEHLLRRCGLQGELTTPLTTNHGGIGVSVATMVASSKK